VFDTTKTKIYLIAGTVVCLLAGYTDLVRGGTTLSAFLLIIAYCVLVPMVIWQLGSKERAADDRELPSYGIAAIVGAVVLAI
jgi:hypothetical protein